MKVYFACTAELKKHFLKKEVVPEDIYVLESFYSISNWQKPYIKRFKGFFLDSGAFTFLNSKSNKKNIDFEIYADKYADFIKENGIRRYFELDIDAIVGLKEVERLRKRIENRCGVQSIPVWHKNRGKDYFIKMCKDYPYVAIGGIVTKEIPLRLYEKMFPWFISTAHKNKTKIHGLGYTNTKKLKDYHFDSVDSSTWTTGRRFGEVALYKKGIISKKANDTGMRLKDTTAINWFSFQEWVKFQKYADKKL